MKTDRRCPWCGKKIKIRKIKPVGSYICTDCGKKYGYAFQGVILTMLIFLGALIIINTRTLYFLITLGGAVIIFCIYLAVMMFGRQSLVRKNENGKVSENENTVYEGIISGDRDSENIRLKCGDILITDIEFDKKIYTEASSPICISDFNKETFLFRFLIENEGTERILEQGFFGAYLTCGDTVYKFDIKIV